MKCYLVTAPNGAKRYAGTAALSKTARLELMEKYGVKKGQVIIKDAEIPAPKAEMLEFVNSLCKELDPEVGDNAAA